ncbi:5-oxoprolinase subunit PxpB [Winogradskyella sp.]|uniref:5-oxoprolinase subunit PxpB n=1 Tax=Winogradskyella sp. TaxID=1883156 RepID=UPI00260C134E|nr:5-oxoprolinase subunit PxpB [Winogradskyella sp.]
MEYRLRYSQYNERSILIEWPAIIDEDILKNILNFKKKVLKIYTKQKVEVIHTYTSILIIYSFTIENVNDKFFELKRLFESQDKDLEVESWVWEIPVYYNDEFGIDLDNFSKAKKLSKDDIINHHTSAIYTVFFIGFLPGFLYLGGLNSKLHFDRKTRPNLDVKKGSVAIGGQQTGIYPQDSPGGWHVIGKTPVELFNASLNPPCKIRPGDKVKFVSIDKATYLDIESQIAKSSFQLKPIPNA